MDRLRAAEVRGRREEDRGAVIPEIRPVDVFADFAECGLGFHPLPANHYTGTHLSMALNGSQQDCEREYPKGIVPAYDGLTVML